MWKIFNCFINFQNFKIFFQIFQRFINLSTTQSISNFSIYFSKFFKLFRKLKKKQIIRFHFFRNLLKKKLINVVFFQQKKFKIYLPDLVSDLRFCVLVGSFLISLIFVGGVGVEIWFGISGFESCGNNKAGWRNPNAIDELNRVAATKNMVLIFWILLKISNFFLYFSYKISSFIT